MVMKGLKTSGKHFESKIDLETLASFPELGCVPAASGYWPISPYQLPVLKLSYRQPTQRNLHFTTSSKATLGLYL